MSETIRHVIERFPDQEETIQKLWETNAAFETLAREHGEVSERLQRYASQEAEPDNEVQAEQLRRRRAALEEEMTTIMDQGTRV